MDYFESLDPLRLMLIAGGAGVMTGAILAIGRRMVIAVSIAAVLWLGAWVTAYKLMTLTEAQFMAVNVGLVLGAFGGLIVVGAVSVKRGRGPGPNRR